MDFLGFVNWRSVNQAFTCLMWFAAGVLLLFVVLHLVPVSGPEHPAAHPLVYRFGAPSAIGAGRL
jgi:hypothetical protein